MRKSRTFSALITTATAGFISLGLAIPADAASSGWSAHVQCTKKRISDDSAHGFVQGHGWALTKDNAWKAAKKNASSQMPKGYRTVHCTEKTIKKGKKP
ncbi:hypothetical protein [Streptomyces sp. NPDC087300]|uniref:hypothetical protein n=1 Tax=Streptomyces sp. NPDC087300 TaxID=3365780 RepID=UPI00382F3047